MYVVTNNAPGLSESVSSRNEYLKQRTVAFNATIALTSKKSAFFAQCVPIQSNSHFSNFPTTRLFQKVKRARLIFTAV